jgi:putative peptidoglycan lipid II flippase
MASGTIVSRILGFARAVLLAVAIGVTTDAADAFGVANQLPNSVYAIIVGGVLNAVMVPTLLRARSASDGGKGYVDRFVTLAITVFLVSALVFTIASPLLVRLYTAGWSEEQLALATAFAYWCLPQLFFYGLYSIFGEVLNSRKAFGPFMWAPVLNNLVSLLGLGAFILIFSADPTGSRPISSWGADPVALLAGSATAGVAAQALILLVSWKRIGLKLSLNFQWRGFGLGPALKAASWSLAMVIVSQIGGLVQTAVASTAAVDRVSNQAIASVAAAAIAWLIFMLPHSVVTVSIATAYFTRIAEHQQAGSMNLFKQDLTTALRVIAMVSVIASALLIVLSYPIARVFVGEYPATASLGNVIAAFMIGLLPFSFVYMMQRGFFALEDTKTPFIFTASQIGIHIAGSITLGIVMPKEFLVVSIALLTAISICIQGLIAYAMLRKKIGDLTGFGVFRSTIKFILAAIPASAAGVLVLSAFGGIGDDSFVLKSVLGAITSAVVVGGIMGGTYLVLLWLLKSQEIGEFCSMLRGRFTRNVSGHRAKTRNK